MTDAGYLGAKPASSPLPHNMKLCMNEGETLEDARIYRRLVGRLLYLTIMRPDLSYALHVLSQFHQSLKQPHLEAAHHVLRYLKGTTGQGLFFEEESDLHLKEFCDTDWQLARIQGGPSQVIVYFKGIHLSLGSLRSNIRSRDPRLNWNIDSWQLRFANSTG